MIKIISGTQRMMSCVEDMLSDDHAVMVVDVSSLPDPSSVYGDVEGTDPRVFPAMVELGGMAVVDDVAAVCSAVRELAHGDVVVLVGDGSGGRVVAPAVAGVVAGFLRERCGVVGVVVRHTALAAPVAV